MNIFILAEIMCDKQIICLAGCGTTTNWDFLCYLPQNTHTHSLSIPFWYSLSFTQLNQLWTMVYYLLICIFCFFGCVILLHRGQKGSLRYSAIKCPEHFACLLSCFRCVRFRKSNRKSLLEKRINVVQKLENIEII